MSTERQGVTQAGVIQTLELRLNERGAKMPARLHVLQGFLYQPPGRVDSASRQRTPAQTSRSLPGYLVTGWSAN